VALVAAWWAWRWSYYGDFFPNTFHAKSGGGAYWSQGRTYLAHALLTSGAWAVVVAVAGRGKKASSLALYAVAVALTHGLYVVRVGGDFMEFRFLLPTLYFALVAWGAQPRESWGARSRAAVVLALLLVNARPIPAQEKRWHLAAEDSFYRLESSFPVKPESALYDVALSLTRAFAGTGLQPRFALGTVGMVGFYAPLPVMDLYGLTSPRVAKQALAVRGRPGHEKWATLEDLLAEGVGFSLFNPWGDARREDTRFVVDEVDYFVVQYSAALEALAVTRGWRFPSLESVLVRLEASPDRTEARRFVERYLSGEPALRDAALLRLR